jgi:hypothetical protein
MLFIARFIAESLRMTGPQSNISQIAEGAGVDTKGGSSKDDHDKKPTHKITDPKDEMSLKNRVAKEKALEKEEEEASKK